MSLKHLVLALSAVTLAACSSDPSGPSGGHSTTISVSNNFFNPTPDTVPAGGVTFSWSNASNSHNVTWDSGPSSPASSSTMTSGTFPVTLVQGTYQYHCTIHGVSMSGTIVVQ